MLVVVAACGSPGESGQESGDSGSGGKDGETLVFADPGWESVRFHNSVAKIIVEEGFGYQTDVMPGSTPATVQGLENGDIDIYMELWTDNIIDVYEKAIKSGKIVELSVNFDDNEQGLYVPTYMIEGDPERGIEPVAPNLKTVKDLPKYWELFKDPEDSKKGRIYGAITGWEVDHILQQKMKTYGLDETYNYFNPGSDAAMVTAIVSAYEKGEPWVGYYWDPTWVMGKYDLTLLEEPDPFPSNKVTVAVNEEMEAKAPEVVEFLRHYQTSSTLTSEALAYMEDRDVSEDEAAKWFLQKHEDLWSEWVPEDVAGKVKSAIK